MVECDVQVHDPFGQQLLVGGLVACTGSVRDADRLSDCGHERPVCMESPESVNLVQPQPVVQECRSLSVRAMAWS